jgi:hypothetical protein
MNPSLQRYLLLGLGGAWCVVMLMRILTAEAPQEVPLQFVSGKPVAKTRAAVGIPDLWQVKRVSTQARDMPEGPKKNIFAPLGESMAVGATTVTAKHTKHTVVVVPLPLPAPPPQVVVAVPPAPPGPTPEELAEQAARQQEELNLRQVREQMGQYRYLGYLSQHGVQKAFVGKGKDIYIIRKGDKLDGKFLVASVDPTIVKLKEPTTSLEASIELKKDGDLGPS